MSDLFSNLRPIKQEIYPDMFLLANFCNNNFDTQLLLKLVKQIKNQAPFRKMMTPNGFQTGIALTNCGNYGWTSDISGYRYLTQDPLTQQNWPLMPQAFLDLAKQAANQVGYANFIPDACLVNYYPIGSKLNSHQDKNEKDFQWPIVSVSIGLDATFQIFGDERNNKPINLTLHDGDVMVWGGKSRLAYHGINTIKADPHNPQLLERINLTFRKAG